MLAPNNGAGRAAKEQGNQQESGKAQQRWQLDGFGFMGSAHTDHWGMVVFHFQRWACPEVVQVIGNEVMHMDAAAGV